ncbi:hypothetical protein PRIPAC_77439 [Pristionchus pacificus]|uniref:Tyr-5 n=1 Tax=Pristionchus pacificus TaxID=54126 RepID=A0A2A6CJW1_PRIPA|nr:hypothetical protein PRIPAC_77439 [Pristionchus pacificus]|eukprot:PDM78400.1 tyr-5 [Pristionchus pacificus]
MHRLADISVIFLLLDVSAAFRDIFSYTLNNKEYVETVEQPWFRVHHYRHTKIPAEQKDQSPFGKHHPVPDRPQEEKPFWTELEKRTFHCTTRACVCEFFGGSNSSLALDQPPSKNTCRMRDGHLLKPAIRKEIRMMTDEERMSVEKALNEMKRDGTYNRLSRIHKYHGVHFGPAFTIWHREFLKRFELTVRKYLPYPHTLGIPYWDTSLDSYMPEPKDSIMFTSTFLGTTNEKGHVIAGPYANWTTMEGLPYITRKLGNDPEGEFLTPARIDWTIAQDDVNKVLAATLPLSTCESHSMDDRHLEYSHDYVHFFISGDMGASWSSSNDVIFIYHHSMVDHIFELWRQRAQNRTARERQYTESDERCFPAWHNGDSFMPFMAPLRNIDGLSNAYTDNMYEFEPRPTCDITKQDCGSKYLHCDVAHNIEPTCMSKIRLGGNCTGFEGSRVCYEAECVQGKCQQIAAPLPDIPKMDEKKQEMRKIKISPFTFSPKLTKDILNM